jgi:hypothetical protein
MKSNAGVLPRVASWAGPVGLLTAAGAVGLGLWQAGGTPLLLWPAVGLLVLMAVLGVVWLSRVRSARRLFAALDAYAERESARAERRRHMSSVARNRVVTRRRRHAVA